MAYQRKTKDTWELWLNYGYGWEYTTGEDSRREIKERCKEYRENQPEYPRKIKMVREPITA